MRRLVLFPLALFACNKSEPAPAGPPAFTPGKLVERRFEAPAFTIQLPENVEAKVEGEAVVASAPGFATITVTVKDEKGGLGSMSSSGSSGAKRTLMTGTRSWKCVAEPSGADKELLRTICDSMTPSSGPTLGDLECATLKGYDAAKVKAAFAANAAAFRACFEKRAAADPKFMGARPSLTINRSGGLASTGLSSGMDVDSQSCLKAAFDALIADAAFAGDGEASCELLYSRY